MAQLDVDFDDVSSEDAARGGFTIISRGRHMMQIIEGEVKDNKNKDGNGYKYKAQYCGDDPEFKDVNVFGWINLSHPKPGVKKAGKAELMNLIKATGQDPHTTKDTDLLLYQPFLADIDVQPNEYKGKVTDQNKIVNFVCEETKDWPIPGQDAPEGDKAPPTAANDNRKAANDNVKQASPPTARTTQNGGAAASGGANRSMPWKK